MSEVQLLKSKNTQIVYLTPKKKLWAILSSGIKKCITKNFKVIIVNTLDLIFKKLFQKW